MCIRDSGNGTASRETEQMAGELIRRVKEQGASVSYMIVSEAGASVYSASPLAAEEFPEYDVNLRSAVSIARRMQDPLAELVKIDPIPRLCHLGTQCESPRSASIHFHSILSAQDR